MQKAIILLLFVGLTTQTPLHLRNKLINHSPVGKCPEKDNATPTYLPDAGSCAWYYECSNGAPYLNNCPDGLFFNTVKNVCDYPKNVNCQVEGERVRIIRPYSPVGECPPQQGEFPVYLPDSKNCSIFYECDRNGNPLPVPCPPGLEFNPVDDVCDFPDHAGCKAEQSKIKPLTAVGKCPEVNGQTPTYLPDSKDCTKFYECDHGDAYELKCAAGSRFDPDLLKCTNANMEKCPEGQSKPRRINHSPIGRKSAYAIVGECPPKNGDFPVYLPDSEDCSAFYECDNGTPYKLYCAPGDLFDSVARICKKENEAKCA